MRRSLTLLLTVLFASSGCRTPWLETVRMYSTGDRISVQNTVTRMDHALECLRNRIRQVEEPQLWAPTVVEFKKPEQLASIATAPLVIRALEDVSPSSSYIKTFNATSDFDPIYIQDPFPQYPFVTSSTIRGALYSTDGITQTYAEVGLGYAKDQLASLGLSRRERLQMIKLTARVEDANRGSIKGLSTKLTAIFPSLKEHGASFNLVINYYAATGEVGKAVATSEVEVVDLLVQMAMYELSRRIFSVPAGCIDEGRWRRDWAEYKKLGKEGRDEVRRQANSDFNVSADAPGARDRLRERLGLPPGLDEPSLAFDEFVAIRDRRPEESQLETILSETGLVVIPTGEGRLHCYVYGPGDRVQRVPVEGLPADRAVSPGDMYPVSVPGRRFEAIRCMLTRWDIFDALPQSPRTISGEPVFFRPGDLEDAYRELDPDVEIVGFDFGS